MNINSPYFCFDDSVSGEGILLKLERIGRVCYKSEGKICPGSAHRFVASLIRNGHESVIEHVSVTVRVICDRGISHEVVRHRIGSYSQESSRYCDYQSKSVIGGVNFIAPFFFENRPDLYAEWYKAMQDADRHYSCLMELGAKPEEARSVLPNSTKTEIVITYNLREWRHFFKMRCSPKAHPQMRELTLPLLKEFKARIPIIFDDLVFNGDV